MKLDIIQILNRLGYPYDPVDIKGGAVWGICPFHSDSSVGSFSINIEKGWYKCFACKTKGGGITKFIMDYLHITWKEAMTWLEGSGFAAGTNISIDNYTDNLIEETEKELRQAAREVQQIMFPKNLVRLNSENVYYCKSHNISQIFVNEFNWYLCTEGYYRDYFVLPIYVQGRIYTFEARKAFEYEKLCEFFETKCLHNIRHYNILKLRFRDLGYKLKKKEICQHGETVYIPDKRKYFLLYYLLRSKVLYGKGARINKTIYNVDNLRYDEPLHLVESATSVPNIWYNKSTNVTATFGSDVRPEQIEILNNFEKIIHYVDNDFAGATFVEALKDKLKYPSRYFIANVKTDGAEATQAELDGEALICTQWMFKKLRSIYADEG